MTADLKPCPFCGGIAHITKSYDPDGFGAFHHVQCSKCRAKGTEFHALETCPIFFEQVRAAWNTRAKTKAADALEADLCAVVKPMEWKDGGNGRWAAWDGYFVIQFMKEPFQSIETGKPTRFCLMRVNADNRYFSRLEEAKAAAQADYEARIISAITIRSASDVAAEARADAINALMGDKDE